MQLRLDELMEWTLTVFDGLDPEKEYQLAFSGGKDSHVLLGMYLYWSSIRSKKLNIKTVFSDTLLEAKGLHHLIDRVEALCQSKDIPFVQVKPPLQSRFWVKLVGIGYPVPNHRNRWCTKDLKVTPMSKVGGIVIAGSHVGESTKRDDRLTACGSSECGIDKIQNKIEPIAMWSNCDVWDWIALYGDTVLYEGAVNNIHALYSIQEKPTESLRMGCFMCPVISKKRIVKQVEDGIIPEFSVEVRELIEELRQAPRINNPYTKKAGAVLVDSRIAFWEKLKPFLLELYAHGWIDKEQEEEVERCLARRAYPPIYKPEWIAEQEPLATPWVGKRKKNK